MKRSFLKRKTSLKKHSSDPHKKAIHKLDTLFSILVRIRDKNLGCITCLEKHDAYDAGHFRRRECMTTRFHPMNVNAQGVKENRFESGQTFEYGLALDKKYGIGCAIFLEKLSRENEGWATEELEDLIAAAKISMRAFEQMYYRLRPKHQFKPVL